VSEDFHGAGQKGAVENIPVGVRTVAKKKSRPEQRGGKKQHFLKNRKGQK